MRRYTVLWIAAALLLAATSAPADEVEDYDRFQLWNGCKPMKLLVEETNDEGIVIGLTTEKIGIAVRSRLRAARLYSEDRGKTGWAELYVNVNTSNRAMNLSLYYKKLSKESGAGLIYPAITWITGAVGTHSNDLNYILSSVSQYTDEFIDEYLRVNADACK